MRAPNTPIARPRLVVLADRVLSARLTLLVAPPGSGKTVLLDQWCSELGNRAEVIRLDLNFGHNAPERFRAALGEAARAVLPTLGWEPGSPISPADLNAFLQAIAQRADPELPLLLVLDRFDVLIDPTGIDTIATALAVLPPQVTVAIASRTQPDLLLAELRTQGRLLELGARELAFTPDEAALLAQTQGTALDGADLARLVERTAGWPVAVSLLTRGRPDDENTLAEYLDEVVLAGLDPADLRFLEDTALLDRVTPALADELRGTTDAGARRQQLERLGRFPILASDQDGDWSLPPVIRQHLERELARRDPARHVRLRRRAAELAALIQPLSNRELEVLGLLESPLTANEIAAELVVSYHTVKSHMRAVYAKLGVTSRIMAVQRAQALGLTSAVPDLADPA